MSESARDVVCYYHEPLKAPLLRVAVLPAMRRAADAGFAVHLERHWLHGPHLRIGIAGPSAGVAAMSADLADELGEHVRRQPSQARLSHSVLLAQATRAGLAELVPPPYEPVWPDNTVRVEDPDATAASRLLGSSTVRIRADVLRVGVAAISETIEYLERHDDKASSRVQVAVIAMTAHASCCPSGLYGGYISYRSHLEDFLHRDDPNGSLRSSYAAIWDRHAKDVTALVAACGQAEEHNQPLAEAWRRWARAAWRIVETAHDRGELAFPAMDEYERRGRALDHPALADRSSSTWRGISEFHKILRTWQPDPSEQFERRFTVYRFCTNMLYLLLTTCDISAMERYLAASLVSEAVERLSGRTWRERLNPARQRGAADDAPAVDHPVSRT